VEDKRQLEEALQRERAAIVVVNTGSRKARRLVHDALERFEQHRITVLSRYQVSDGGSLQATLRDAIAAHDCRLVVVGGGDGTVSEAVDFLAGQDRVLGLLPLGTSNNFARTLGIPLGLDAAVDVIASGKVADVDLGRVDGDYFANVASVGLTVDVAARVPSWTKRYFGRLGYVVTGLVAMISQQPFHAALTVDGVTHQLLASQLVIANGRFHAGRPIVARASADDRQLIVQAIIARGRLRLIRSLVAYFAGHGDRLPDTLIVSGRELTLDCAPQQRLEIDGELKATTPLRISVAAEALNVMVPQTFEDR